MKEEMIANCNYFYTIKLNHLIVWWIAFTFSDKAHSAGGYRMEIFTWKSTGNTSTDEPP